ncbi:MAG: phosphoglucosamine mutase [Clostridia bacterium]|nr:phosphoglucosamine mutase [Clostridia bacterium]
MGKYFGTDGFRGLAGVELSALHAFSIGSFLAHYLKKTSPSPRVVIGKDTRRSSYMLEYALASGLASFGADAYMLHVTTTPSVSFVCSSEAFDLGIMISASHNPYYDNGIKILNSRGEKIDEELTSKIEEFLDSDVCLPALSGKELGKILDHSAGRNRYIGYLISTSPYSFKGKRVGLDLSNGGAFMIARVVFEALGASVFVMGAEPNGTNINEGVGSTHIDALCSFVLENKLDVGFAFDGDADRCIAVDENGQIINGDYILYILANQLKKQGELKGNKIVTTIMSSSTLTNSLKEKGIHTLSTKVGDKYVYECMQKNDLSLGGEESGHIILSKYATTGDGILTSIKLMESMISEKCPLSYLVRDFSPCPRVCVSVRLEGKAFDFSCLEPLNLHLTDKSLGYIDTYLGDYRVLVRKSGTEPVVRVLVEGQDKEKCIAYANQISEVIKNA